MNEILAAIQQDDLLAKLVVILDLGNDLSPFRQGGHYTVPGNSYHKTSVFSRMERKLLNVEFHGICYIIDLLALDSQVA